MRAFERLSTFDTEHLAAKCSLFTIRTHVRPYTFEWLNSSLQWTDFSSILFASCEAFCCIVRHVHSAQVVTLTPLNVTFTVKVLLLYCIATHVFGGIVGTRQGLFHKANCQLDSDSASACATVCMQFCCWHANIVAFVAFSFDEIKLIIEARLIFD